jgi:hypothetical protein
MKSDCLRKMLRCGSALNALCKYTVCLHNLSLGLFLNASLWSTWTNILTLDRNLPLNQLIYPFNFVFLVRLEAQPVRKTLRARAFQHRCMLRLPRLGKKGRRTVIDIERINLSTVPSGNDWMRQWFNTGFD